MLEHQGCEAIIFGLRCIKGRCNHDRDRRAGVNGPGRSNTLATLRPAPLVCCRWELEQRHMAPPSNIVLPIVIEEDPKLVRRLNTYCADAAPDGVSMPSSQMPCSMSSVTTSPVSRGVAVAAWMPLDGP
jgi:hypothetical protein